MSMPKGFKIDNGYATTASLGGKSYKEIADIMSERGDKMNHSTARNIFLRSMQKIAVSTCELYGVEISASNIKRIANDPRFQSGLSQLIKENGIDI
jgi:hypothetical protein